MHYSSSAIPPTPTAPLRKAPPIFISTNPSDLDAVHLRRLLHASNLSCHRFPDLSPLGRVPPVDLPRLRLALANSAVVVSAFCASRHLHTPPELGFGFDQIFQRALPFPPSDRTLVGFGRAVSDGGLTASIHDVVVTSSLRRLGIGRKIIQTITRYLTSKDIYDISALCSEDERLFFKACGFGNDYLGATTMMYTRSGSIDLEGSVVKKIGRTSLLVPPAFLP